MCTFGLGNCYEKEKFTSTPKINTRESNFLNQSKQQHYETALSFLKYGFTNLYFGFKSASSEWKF